MKLKLKQLSKGMLSIIISAVILSFSSVINTLPVSAVDSASLSYENDGVAQIVNNNKTDDAQLDDENGADIPLTDENSVFLQDNEDAANEKNTDNNVDNNSDAQQDSSEPIVVTTRNEEPSQPENEEGHKINVTANPIGERIDGNDEVFDYSNCTGKITITIISKNDENVKVDYADASNVNDITAKAGDTILVSGIPNPYQSDKYGNLNYGLNNVKYKRQTETDSDYRSVIGSSEGKFYFEMPDSDIDISATFGWLHSAFVSATSKTSVNFIIDVSGDGDYYLDELHDPNGGNSSNLSHRQPDGLYSDYFSVWAIVSTSPEPLDTYVKEQQTDVDSQTEEDKQTYAEARKHFVWVKGILTEHGTTANITVDVENIHYADYNDNESFVRRGDATEEYQGTVEIPGYDYNLGSDLYIKVFVYDNRYKGEGTAGRKISGKYDDEFRIYGQSSTYKIPRERMTDEPIELTSMTYNGSKYTLYSSNYTWTQANNFCNEKNGHLATIKDHDEWMNVIADSELTRYSNGACAWLGAYAGADNVWHWVDDVPYDPYNTTSSSGEEAKYNGDALGNTAAIKRPNADHLSLDSSSDISTYDNITNEGFGYVPPGEGDIAVVKNETAAPGNDSFFLATYSSNDWAYCYDSWRGFTDEGKDGGLGDNYYDAYGTMPFADKTQAKVVQWRRMVGTFILETPIANITYKYLARYDNNNNENIVEYTKKGLDVTDQEIVAKSLNADTLIKYAPYADTIKLDTVWNNVSVKYTDEDNDRHHFTVTAVQSPRTYKVYYPELNEEGYYTYDDDGKYINKCIPNVIYNSLLVEKVYCPELNEEGYYIYDYNSGKYIPDVIAENDNQDNYLLKAPEKNEKGEKFVCWKVYEANADGDKLGTLITTLYQRTFAIRIISDCYLEPVYASEGETVKASADLATPVLNREQYDGADRLYADLFVSYYSEKVPVIKDNKDTDDYIVECGVILDCNEGIVLSDDDIKILEDLAVGKTSENSTDSTDEIINRTIDKYIGNLSLKDKEELLKSIDNYDDDNENSHTVRKFVVTKSNLTNMNRVDKVIRFKNTDANRNHIFAAYSYIIVRNAQGEVEDMAISNVQYFNFCYIGLKENIKGVQ